jgi:inositol transport system permease protein
MTMLTAEQTARQSASRDAAEARSRQRRRRRHDARILVVLCGIALMFEAIGWMVRGDSFLTSPQRVLVMVLQVSIIGLLAVGVTQVIIAGGIDLSSGSVVALSAMVAASLAQDPGNARAVFPSLSGLPFVVPVAAGLAVGSLAGAINGALIAFTGIPAFIATLGMMVTARGLARFYTRGQPISMLSERYTWIGEGAVPVVIFVGVATVFYLALRYTRYGKFTYAIGANANAASVSGINVRRHLIVVYTVAGFLSGLGGVVTSARAASGQAGMGTAYELDAIAAAVIGGTSLSGGVGRISGTVIGTMILGVMTSGFTFIGFDAYIQDIVKGVVIVLAVIADQYRQKARRKS